MSSSPESSPPKVSVISIALKPEEFDPVVANLSRQTFRDYEFVGEAGGAIPAAWNRAIRRARGEILVLTETDATPVDEYWLEQMVSSLSAQNDIVKGLEVKSTSWDLSNLAIHRSVFTEHSFDDSFGWAADTELLCRLKAHGYRLVSPAQAPVVHLQKGISRHYFRRAFHFGLNWARLKYKYANPVEVNEVSFADKLFVSALLNFLGLFIGYLILWPVRFKQKQA
jgi:GT2 family glycosyltransferase